MNAMRQRDALSVISEAFDGFNALMTTCRGQDKSLKNFEMRFSAAMARFNAPLNTTKLPH